MAEVFMGAPLATHCIAQERKPVSFESALIIHRYPYSETSVLLKLFVRERGMIPAIAKGARAPKSKVRGLCHPFVPLWIQLIGKGEVKTVKQIDMAEVLPPMQPDILLSALYLNELLMALLPPEEPMPALFDLYFSTLKRLSCGSLNQVLREFEWHLLGECGYAMSLDVDQSGALISAEKTYELMPGQMPILSQRHSGQYVYQGSDLLSISEGDFQQASCAKQAKRLLRQWLDFYTHGKLIKSRGLLRGCYDKSSKEDRSTRSEC